MNSVENTAAKQTPPQEIIVTLEVQEGKKAGQPIGSYAIGRRSFSLVFLPSDAPVGKKVRVRLVPIGKDDTRGNPLYSGVPARVEYTDRWKDNGDGTASCVTVSTDWLLNEKEEGEDKRKTLGKNSPRPDRATKSVRHTIDLNTSLAMATVLEETVVATPLMDERVDNTVPGGLVWVEKGKSEIVEKSGIFAVSRIGTGSNWGQEKVLSPVWGNDWSVDITVYFVKDGSDTSVTESISFGKLPPWAQSVHGVKLPLCSCQRERVAVHGHPFSVDEYPKCSKCRSEAHCDRCNKAGTTEKLSFLSGRLVCQSCLPYEKAEQLINQQLTVAHKAKVVAEAEKLLLGQAMPAELGLLVLKSGLGHVGEGRNKEQILARWNGYQWYYLTDEGIFGSKFSPAALQVFRYFCQATGNGLVEMMAWLAGGQKVDPGQDFFTKTQVKSENATLPQVEDIVQRLAAGSDVLSDRLRGSEKSRLLMLDAVKSVEPLRSDAFRAGAFREIQTLMEGEAQEYDSVIQKIAELKALKPPPPPPPPPPSSRRASRRQSRSDRPDWEAIQKHSAQGKGLATLGDLFPDL